MSLVFEVDYSIKDAVKWKAAPKLIPQYVVADSIADAVKRATEFEDDNLTLLKCNLALQGQVAMPKKYKGIEPQKEAAVTSG
jgi:hypothetical protein